LSDHVAKDRTDGIEPLIGGADVVEPIVVQEDLLNDEDGDRLAQFRTCLHNSKAERDDFGSKEEVDNLGRVILDQGPDDTEGRQTEVLERPGLGGRVEERVEEEGDMR
jgi:hypothetical protein